MRYLIVLALLCPFLSSGQPTALKEKILKESAARPSGTGLSQPKSDRLPSPHTPLSVGDNLPAVPVNNIINHAAPAAPLTSFTGKPLLISFFATWCTACLASFRHLDSLRQHFGPELAVLMVNAASTGDNEKKIEAFLDKRRRADGSRFTFPILSGDTLLSALFPHRLIPHYAWLDSTRKVVAITTEKELTVQNISAFLAGRPLRLPLKQDWILSYNPDLPLLYEGNGGEGSSLRYSAVFTGHLPGMPASVRRTASKITALNLPAFTLYQEALSLPANRIRFEGLSQARLEALLNSPKAETNLHSLELTFPGGTPPGEVQRLLLRQLDAGLNLSGSFRKEKRSCWVLRTTGNPSALRTKGGRPSAQWHTEAAPLTILKNGPLSALVEALNGYVYTDPLPPIVLNESGLTTPVDLTLRAPLSNLPALAAELCAYNLSLEPAEREIEVFVISEAPPGPGKHKDQKKIPNLPFVNKE